MTRRPVLEILSVCLVSSACAPWPVEVTPAVTGRVIDTGTRAPVPNAKVYVTEFPANAAKTSETGEYELQPNRRWEIAVLGTDRRPNYRLAVEADGYAREERVWYTGDDRPQQFEMNREVAR